MDVSPQPPSLVVGLGASAGGVEALQRFFEAMPPSTGLAFIVVQHLSPDHPSFLPEILARSTAMHVARVEDGMSLRADSVYLMPPRGSLTVEKGRLHLGARAPAPAPSLPIDVLFRSLAEDLGERAVGIILSGAALAEATTDGTRGVRAIKEAGGLVIVQSEASAHFEGMPHSAISTGLADFVLPPERMPEVLIRYLDRSRSSDSAGALSEIEAAEDHLAAILTLLRQHSGVEFTHYRASTVLRRIERRMNINQIALLPDYGRFAAENPREVAALCKDLLIGVTRFFRDPEAFDLIKRRVIPAIVEATRPTESVRVWVPACATGEEAYTLGMLFLEHMDTFQRAIDVKIFATDVDRDAIEVGSVGTYPESVAADVSAERLSRFFVRGANSWQVSRRLRQTVIFAPHNVIQDPPFTRMDLISCRNLLIYLESVLQKKLLHLFHFALKPSRYLLLGSSESIGDLTEHFKSLDNKWKLFQRSAAPRTLAAETLPIGWARERRGIPWLGAAPSRSVEDTSAIEAARHALIAEFAPLTLLINEACELVHVFGDAAGLLTVPPGTASLNLLKMVPRALTGLLGTAVHKALREREEVVYRNMRVTEDSPPCTLRVRPISDVGARQHLLVMLEAARAGPEPAGAPLDLADVDAHTQLRIADLQQELQYVKEGLQATIAERELANEELQAANEELLAANEELQSTNEELQSSNEELYTVNAEYQSKIQELSELSGDIDNLLRSSNIAALFVDRDMAIRRFTQTATGLVNLMPRDVGRPLRHISLNFDGEGLLRDIRGVLSGWEPVEREIVARDGRRYTMRVLPYMTDGGDAKGAVITFHDITATQNAEQRLQRLVDALGEPLGARSTNPGGPPLPPG